MKINGLVQKFKGLVCPQCGSDFTCKGDLYPKSLGERWICLADNCDNMWVIKNERK